MPRTLKRRSDAISRDDSPASASTPQPQAQASTSRTQPTTSSHNRRRPRSPSASSSASSANSDVSSSASADLDFTHQQPTTTSSTSSTSQTHTSLVKKLIRLALSSEYARQPLRRTEITSKIFKGSGVSGRGFKRVFADANRVLGDVFGMRLVEVGGREKFGLKDRRREVELRSQGNGNGNGRGAKGKSKRKGKGKGRAGEEDEEGENGDGSGSGHGKNDNKAKEEGAGKSWILISILPEKYRDPRIIVPTKAPTTDTEAGYTALYTFIVSLVYLNAGELSEGKLERYLEKVNVKATGTIEWGMTEKVLARMVREGYLERRREDGEGWVYTVGQRGKVEVGVGGVAGLVKGVYGVGRSREEADEGEEDEEEDGNGNGEGQDAQRRRAKLPKMEVDELNRRLMRSLGVSVGRREEGAEEAVNGDELARGQRDEPEPEPQQRRKSGRRRAARNDDSG